MVDMNFQGMAYPLHSNTQPQPGVQGIFILESLPVGTIELPQRNSGTEFYFPQPRVPTAQLRTVPSNFLNLEFQGSCHDNFSEHQKPCAISP